LTGWIHPPAGSVAALETLGGAVHTLDTHDGAGVSLATQGPWRVAVARSTIDGMSSASTHRTLVVANRTAATPLLLQEIEDRAGRRPTEFVLLIPSASSGGRPDWTLTEAVAAIRRAARGPTGHRTAVVRGLPGGAEPLESIKQVLAAERFDDVIVSTRRSRGPGFLRHDLSRRVQRLGIPVLVVTQPREKRMGLEEVGLAFGGPG